MTVKKTLVLGASPNPQRYSFRAIHSLLNHGHPVVPVGNKKGEVGNIAIEPASVLHTDIDTITLYMRPEVQKSHYDYILNTNPRRIIFNPGTENPELKELAMAKNILVEEACTLVLLALGNY